MPLFITYWSIVDYQEKIQTKIFNSTETGDKYVNLFQATDLSLYPPKTSESRKFSNIFRRYRKRPVGKMD